jgi:hypothetical protein
MNMNLWQAEQLAADRRSDFERAADVHRQLPETTVEPVVAASRVRPAFARHVGVLLIAIGRRLAEPDSFPAAFDGPHHH